MDKVNSNTIQMFFNTRLGICKHCGHPFLLPPRFGGPLRSTHTKPCPKCRKPVRFKV